MRILIVLVCINVWIQELKANNSSEVFISQGLRRGFPSFVFLMQQTLFTDGSQIFCISLHDCELPAKLTIILKTKRKPEYVLRYNLDHDNACLKLDTPKYLISDSTSFIVDTYIQIDTNNGIRISAHNLDPISTWNPKPLLFISTDKSSYRAGEIVKIRLLILDRNIRPTISSIDLIELRNPVGIACDVWQNIRCTMGFALLEYTLPSNSLEGKWSIASGDQIVHFHVNRNIRSRFNVVMFSPKTHYWKNTLAIDVCSTYYYGKHLKGTVFIRLKSSTLENKEIQRVKEVKSGCVNFTFFPSEIVFNTESDEKQYIDIAATMTESKTDQMELVNGKILLLNNAYQMKFDHSVDTFLPGFLYTGRLQFTNCHTNMALETILICYTVSIKKSWNYYQNQQCKNFTLQDTGGDSTSLIFTILPLKEAVVQIVIEAHSVKYAKIHDTIIVKRYYSSSGNYILLEQQNPKNTTSCRDYHEFKVQFNTNRFSENETLILFYAIKVRNVLYKFHKFTHRIKTQLDNIPKNRLINVVGVPHKFTINGFRLNNAVIKIKANEVKFTMKFDLLVYYITSGGHAVTNLINDVKTPFCIQNLVRAKWEKREVLPGTTGSLQLELSSDSMCSINAVDKSTTLSSLTNRPSLLTQLLKQLSTTNETPSSDRKTCIAPNKRHKGSHYYMSTVMEKKNSQRHPRHAHSFAEDYDSFDIFNKFGTVVISNLNMVTKLCYTGPSVPTNISLVQMLTMKYVTQDDELEQVPIRYDFPDTWLWELVPYKKQSIKSVTLKRTLPHSITKWVTEVLCVSSTEGIGLHAPFELTVFQPFFVDVLAPKSLKKGETLYLHVTLFNYLNHSLPIRLLFATSHGLHLINAQQKSRISFCIMAQNSVTNIFAVKGTIVGLTNVTVIAEVDSSYPGQCGPNIVINRRDVVLKSLQIEPEGFRFENVISSFLCADKVANNISWNVNLPKNDAIPHTRNIKVVINADILGPTLNNLNRLLDIPTGCGEQIMATAAPNLYVMQYLNATGKLTSLLRQKIRRNLKIGYQSVLNYVHKDGSFSAFGYHDPMGSMFLTAFVLKTLNKAQSVIFVNPHVIHRASKWIFDHQLENGCFATMQHVFQDMGGTTIEDSTATLTSYVIISLIESGIEIPTKIIANSKYCIRGHYDLNKYRLAISSYALLQLGWKSEAERMLEKLFQIAEKRNNMMWWSEKDSYGSIVTDIEITSYVLLSLLHQHSTDSMAKAYSVVRWLITKLTNTGGFKSTQDTVLALEALAKYSKFIAPRSLNLKVNVTTNLQNNQVQLKKSDKLLSKEIVVIQSAELDSNTISMHVSGTGCALVQMIDSYYRDKVSQREAFILNMSTIPLKSKCSSTSILTPCFKYNGPYDSVNMAVLEIGLPSGHEIDTTFLITLKTNQSSSNINMFENYDDKFIAYFTKLKKEEICFNITVNRKMYVSNQSSSLVKLRDYYRPEFEAVQLFQMENKCILNKNSSNFVFN